jgi:CheY-like chemotaxis protein
MVQDNGNGFDVSNMEPDASKDSGFVLFNIRERIDLLGGRLDINSAPGRGTNVALIVPLDGEEMEKRELQDKVNQAEEEQPRIKVLLVDDHKMMREGLKRIIGSEDDMCVTAEAPDGRDIMNLVRESKPDVVIMDVNLPGRNGIELTRELKDKLSDIHVVGLSLYDDEEVAQSMRDAGASAYLTKTEASETLCATIRSVGNS